MTTSDLYDAGFAVPAPCGAISALNDRYHSRRAKRMTERITVCSMFDRFGANAICDAAQSALNLPDGTIAISEGPLGIQVLTIPPALAVIADQVEAACAVGKECWCARGLVA